MIGESIYRLPDFSRQYFLLRKEEGRIYSDQELSRLPDIDKQHQHYYEWQVRKNSCNQLKKYLINKKGPLQILEIGCGNGWLSANLSTISASRITGIDINPEELSQAKRVFSRIGNVEFFNCSLQDELISDRRFDVIIFAASIQYFPSLKTVLDDAIAVLRLGGEIHIIDSNFYAEKELKAARERSRDYFYAIGFPEMTEQYFHHSFGELEPFHYKVLYHPKSIFNRLKRNKNPFYWICIKKHA